MSRQFLIRVGVLVAGLVVIFAGLHFLKISPTENPKLYFSLRYGLVFVLALGIYAFTRNMKKT
jgi:hypothetical protein